METNLEKAERLLKANAAIIGVELKGDEYLFKMLELAATPDIVKANCNLQNVINWVSVYDRLPDKRTFCITKDETDCYNLQYWKGYWETEYPVKENDVIYWAEVEPPCL